MSFYFFTKIAGVTHENRQENILRLYEGQQLQLLREPTNPYDSNAIAVIGSGRQIGYIPRNIALRLAPKLDSGYEAKIQITNLTGGGNKNRGVNVKITVCSPDEIHDRTNNYYSEKERVTDSNANNDINQFMQGFLRDSLKNEQRQLGEEERDIDNFQALLRKNFMNKL